MLGVKPGYNGTLFMTYYLTDILKSISRYIKTVGFNGVIYSLLEDRHMAKNNNYTIDSLISYASVCGCGVDMIPVPGDISKSEITSIILDINALSTKLNKPLGVRILPIPHKKAGEFTNFKHSFMVNTKIREIKCNN